MTHKFTIIKQYRSRNSPFITVRYTDGINTFTCDVETDKPEITSMSFWHMYYSILGKVRKLVPEHRAHL
jgi:hypothetical protein